MRVHVLFAAILVAACSRTAQDPLQPGQDDFVSAPPGQSGTGAGSAADAGAAGTPAPSAGSAAGTRAVEETDIYRLDGNRLYVLNGYRGLLVFDVSDVDHPVLLGRSPIYGWPVEMVVHGGIASIVVSDWYGMLEDGTPFHGSVVRSLDTADPANIRKLGETPLAGWVRDTRVVGEVLYAVSVDYGWAWAAAGVSATSPSVAISSIDLAGGATRKAGERVYAGWNGIIHVTANAILLARDTSPWDSVAPETELTYIDISDPAGAIVERGTRAIAGHVQGWGQDNGRWNLDFSDGKTARALACDGRWCGEQGAPYVLSMVDFTDPDRPSALSSVKLGLRAWVPAVRFDGSRMYLSPATTWSAGVTTPLDIYDLENPAQPRLAGEAQIPGTVWSFFPQGTSVIALGAQPGTSSNRVSLTEVDATDPANPAVVGTAAFGDGWAWTPAAGTFKAFTRNDTDGLIALPFSGWSTSTFSYRNGLQLIELAGGSIQVAGAALTKGWVERGIFANGRLLALSDQALAVVDFADHQNPRVVNEVTLARNVVASLPMGDRIAEVSSDFWDNDQSTSLLRVLPVAEADEMRAATAVEVRIDGINPRVFRNGDLAYAITDVATDGNCAAGSPAPIPGGCRRWNHEVQVIDLSGGTARLRGKVLLPGPDSWQWAQPGLGFAGCFAWDWFNGADAVQVDASALAVRRWVGGSASTPPQPTVTIVDLANPDAPSSSDVQLTNDASAWWGNLVVVGGALYVTHTEWVDRPPASHPTVRYFANRIDFSSRAHPRIASRVNLPGVLIGGSSSDPSLLYVTGYRWDADRIVDSFDVLQVRGDRARLVGAVDFPGWVGRVFVRGTTALASVQSVDGAGHWNIALHQVDFSNPAYPRDLAAASNPGWGWLVAVEGDRAIVTSGWTNAGLDIYRLQDGAAPRLDQFVRTRGYWPWAIARQGDQLFVSSGWWGVTTVQLRN